MKASAFKVAALLTVALPVHVLLIVGGGVAGLVLLVYAGVVLPSVWSSKSARRKAAAAVLRDILVFLRRG